MISENGKNTGDSTIYGFSGFRLEAENLLLLRNSEVVPLAPKAVEVLLTLIKANGKLITKQEILEKVWANTFVEETNLTHHISALRKALGEDNNGRKFIETIPRRGYRFVATLNERHSSAVEITLSERTTARFIEEVEIQTDALDEPVKIVEPMQKQLAPTVSRRLVFFAASGFLAALLIGFIAFISYWRRIEPTRAAENNLISFTRLSDGRDVGAAVISPDGKFVAYIQNYNVAGGGTLFLRQLETNREIMLLEPDERTFGNIDFSPDGSLIYYISFEKNAKIGSLYSISILGGTPRRLFDLDATSAFFSVSPDGKQVAFYRVDTETQTASLVIAPLDGTSGDARVLLSHPASEASFWEWIAWSPDSRFLVLNKVSSSESEANSQLFSLDLQTLEITLLSDEKFYGIGKKVFRPDGRELFFVASKLNSLQQIYALDLPSRKVRRVTNDTNSYGNYGMGISADGKNLVADLFEIKADLWRASATGGETKVKIIKRGETNGKRGLAALPDNSIAYIVRVANRYDIWKTNAEGTNTEQLTNDAFEETGLTASRDGRFLVFSSDRAGGRHLFRMNADGSDVKQLTSGDSSDTQPDFSPDGKWIVYAAGQAEKSCIKKVSVEDGTPVELTDFYGFYPTFSPDGTRIAMKFLSSSRSLPGEIVVISANGGKPEKTFPVTQFEHANVVIPIHWSPDGKGIVFRKEKNSIGNLWQQNLDDSAPHQITDFTSDVIYNFVYSSDGSRLFLSRGIYQTNAVLITNFESE